MSKKSKKPENQICANKKARHEYFIEETLRQVYRYKVGKLRLFVPEK